jgi:hypothetical protein
LGVDEEDIQGRGREERREERVDGRREGRVRERV